MGKIVDVTPENADQLKEIAKNIKVSPEGIVNAVRTYHLVKQMEPYAERLNRYGRIENLLMLLLTELEKSGLAYDDDALRRIWLDVQDAKEKAVRPRRGRKSRDPERWLVYELSKLIEKSTASHQEKKDESTPSPELYKLCEAVFTVMKINTIGLADRIRRYTANDSHQRRVRRDNNVLLERKSIDDL